MQLRHVIWHWSTAPGEILGLYGLDRYWTLTSGDVDVIFVCYTIIVSICHGNSLSLGINTGLSSPILLTQGQMSTPGIDLV